MPKQNIQALGALCQLKQDELDRLQNKVAKKQAEAIRYQTVIDQLDALNAPASASSSLSMLSANHGQYKTHLLALKKQQSDALLYVEHELSQTRSQALQSWQSLESLKGVRHDLIQSQLHQKNVQEQKNMDGIATQAWLRSRIQNHQAMEG